MPRRCSADTLGSRTTKPTKARNHEKETFLGFVFWCRYCCCCCCVAGCLDPKIVDAFVETQLTRFWDSMKQPALERAPSTTTATSWPPCGSRRSVAKQ